MPKTENRKYKKSDGKHRDASRFIIVAEGEREGRYFAWFQNKNPRRLSIEIIPHENHESAPQHLLSRLNRFLPENNRLEGDQVWFVLDVDN